MEEQGFEKQKSNRGMLIALIVAIVLILSLVVYICYDKGIIFSNNTTTTEVKANDNENDEANVDDEEKEDTSSSTSSDETNAKTCVGTYYGETSGTLANGISYNYKYTYVLNADGTFTADFGGVSAATGVYTINDNTISLTRHKETTGPREEDPYYATDDYIIADDCSYIRITDESNVTFNLNKQ